MIINQVKVLFQSLVKKRQDARAKKWLDNILQKLNWTPAVFVDLINLPINWCTEGIVKGFDQWCIENCNGRWHRELGCFFWFENKDDAIRFKVRWS